MYNVYIGMEVDIFKTKPDFINAQGTKFWLDKFNTDYAKNKGLKNTKVFYLKDKKGYKTRTIIKDGKYKSENQSLEAIGIKIDLLAFLEKEEKC